MAFEFIETTRSKFLLCALIVLQSLHLNGCDDVERGARLAKAGSVAADSVGQFYDEMAAMCHRTIELRVVTNEYNIRNTARRFGKPVPADKLPVIDMNSTPSSLVKESERGRLEAMELRAGAYHRLSETYAALAGLSSDEETAAGIEVSADRLGTALASLASGPSPVGAVVGILGKIAASFEDARKSRDVRRAATRLKTVVVGLREVFEAEASDGASIYRDIARENLAIRVNIAGEFQRKGLLDRTAFYDDFVRPLGYRVSGRASGGGDPFNDVESVNVVARSRAIPLLFAAERRAAAGIDALVGAHDDFDNERESSGLAAMAAANGLLDSLAELRAVVR